MSQKSKDKFDERELLSSKYLSLSNKEITTEVLRERLKNLTKYLSSADQTDEVCKKLDATAAALVQTPILQHKDRDVKLLAACALADVIRIYAPDAPYEDAQLQKIFTLFISQLEEGLKTSKGDEQIKRRYFTLLEKLAVVKAFILLINIDDNLIVRLFKVFFDNISESHANVVKTHILDIMCAIIEESDSIAQPVLDTILANLLSQNKKERPVATRLAQTLISRTAGKLQPDVTRFLLDPKEANSELEDDVYELIYELYKITPTLLLKIIPVLQERVEIADPTERGRAVGVLARMFAVKNSTMAVDYHQLFVSFLRRFQDREPKIRMVMVEFGKYYLMYQNSDLEDVEDAIRKRVLDPEEDIRKAAVIAICEAAKERPDVISVSLLKDVGDRMRDKKIGVRKEAMRRLALLYSTLTLKDSDYAEDPKYLWIPSKILLCLISLPELEDSWRVERILDEVLLPADADIKQRTKLFFNQLVLWDQNARNAFFRLLKEKKSFQEAFSQFLELRTSDDESQISELVTLISQKCPNPDGIQNVFKRIERTKDNTVVKHLHTLCKADSKFNDIRTARNELLKKLGGSKEAKTSVRHLTQRLAMSIIGKENIPLILKLLRTHADSSLFGVILEFLAELSGIFPSLFTGSFSEIVLFLDERDELVVENAVKIISNTAELLSDSSPSVAKSLKKLLSDKCIEGNEREAKYAIKAMSRIYKNKSDVFRSLLEDLMSHLTTKAIGKELNSVLTSLGYLAELAHDAFNSRRNEVIQFVVSLLEKTHTKKKGQTQEGVSKSLALKILIRYLVAYEFQSGDVAQKEAEKLLLLLFKVLKTQGELTKTESTSADDKALLRLTAANGIVKLAQFPRYEALFSPEQFQLLAWTIQDENEDVRARLAAKIHNLLRALKLPLRYLSILGLCATDPLKEIVHSAKQYLVANIRVRRDFIKTLDDLSATQTVDLLPEYSIPHFIHLLAHHPRFIRVHKDIYTISQVYLNFYFEPLFHTTTDSFSFLISLLDGIMHTRDVQDPNSENIYILASIAIRIVKQQSDMRRYTLSKHTGEIFLPKNLFRELTDTEALELKDDYLPSTFQLYDSKKPLLTSPEKPKKRKEVTESEDEAEEQPKAPEPKKVKKKSKKRSAKQREEEEEQEEQEEEEQQEEEEEEEEKEQESEPEEEEKEEEPEEEEEAEEEESVAASKKRKVPSPQQKKGKKQKVESKPKETKGKQKKSKESPEKAKPKGKAKTSPNKSKATKEKTKESPEKPKAKGKSKESGKSSKPKQAKKQKPSKEDSQSSEPEVTHRRSKRLSK